MTEAETTDSTMAEAAEWPAKAANTQRHAATFAAVPMRDLITCARVFYAAIHVGSERFSDDDFEALAGFDDFLAEAIASRRPETAEDFAAKAHYLIGRVQDGTLTDAADAAALTAIKANAAAFAGAVEGLAA